MPETRHSQIDIDALKTDLRNRLERVCAEWSVADKEALIDKVIENELRFPSGRLTADILVEIEAERLQINNRRK